MDLAAEYAAARQGCAFVPLLDRGVLAVTGPHRLKLLHNVLSNDVEGLAPGQGCRAALMDVKGRQVAWMRALVEAGAVHLEVDGGRLGRVEQALDHYKVGAPVRFAARPTAVLALVGPGARDALRRAGCEAPDLPREAHVAGSLAGVEVRVARAGDLPAGGLVLHAPPGAAAAVAEALGRAGARALSPPTFDVLRIEDGRPFYGVDVGEGNLLHETGVLTEYHSYRKGCYVGQEVVARLEARGGNVNKRLCLLRLGAAAAAGDPILAGGEEVGRLTTAGVSPRSGPLALGYVRRSHFTPGTSVEVRGAAAEVAPLPAAG